MWIRTCVCKCNRTVCVIHAHVTTAGPRRPHVVLCAPVSLTFAFLLPPAVVARAATRRVTRTARILDVSFSDDTAVPLHGIQMRRHSETRSRALEDHCRTTAKYCGGFEDARHRAAENCQSTALIIMSACVTQAAQAMVSTTIA